MNNYFITKDGDDWKLKKEGSQRATKVADTKSDIIKQTQKFAEGKEISVKIKGVDGKFQEERTYPKSRDPKKSKG